ncbi:hypothetical protein BDN71DRAFT_1458973 [Pleurotus eryngii]|uniref:Uncharacterized protein n=1 Tax=Pleurotus eryngii TaxID=5323 RepID=A0A9P5ZH13_PLEER|nr:hypothetical protein BDN71DRAFT_1458973 [Pleurotus eryngii]
MILFPLISGTVTRVFPTRITASSVLVGLHCQWLMAYDAGSGLIGKKPVVPPGVWTEEMETMMGFGPRRAVVYPGHGSGTLAHLGVV